MTVDLDRVFGVGLWVRCEDCPATEQAFAWHHREYHGRKTP